MGLKMKWYKGHFFDFYAGTVGKLGGTKRFWGGTNQNQAGTTKKWPVQPFPRFEKNGQEQ